MRDEEIEINKAIAEACGWQYDEEMRQWITIEPRGRFWHESAPNYCNDLNAMHEAEKFLDDRQWEEYTDELSDMCGRANAITSTARERAEVFRRILGKWKE